MKLWPCFLDIPPQGYRWETDEDVRNRLRDNNNLDLKEICRTLIPLGENEFCFLELNGMKVILDDRWYENNPR